MTNEEYVKRLGEMYNKIVALRTNDDYVVNHEQMEKLADVMGFFTDMSQKQNGEIEPIALSPKEEHGGVTAKFLVFDVYGEDLKRFCEVLQKTSAMSIDSEESGRVCISVTVPNVFVPKEIEA